MNDLLLAKVNQLEKQLELYTNIVLQQQEALHDVNQVLQRASFLPATAVDHLRQRVGSALSGAARQSSGRGGGHEQPKWSPERAARVSKDLSEYAQGVRGRDDGGVCSREHLEERCVTAADRIHATVKRLLGVWLEHIQRRVSRIMEDPRIKFQCFHDAPAEDTLTDFMDSFVDASEGVATLFSAAVAECHDAAGAAAPSSDARSKGGVSAVTTGNPFTSPEEEERLRRLFAATIHEIISDDAVNSTASATRDEVNADDKSDSQVSDADASHGGGPLAATKRPMRGAEVTPVAYSPMPNPHQHPKMSPSIGKPKPPLPSALLQQQQKQPQQENIPLYSRPASSQAGGHIAQAEPVSATPRSAAGARGRANDSSQIWSAMGIGEMPLKEARDDRPPPLREPATSARASGAGSTGEPVQSEKLRQLNAVLQQLEFQLAGVAMSGRSTGSEAKYYALSKKLQRVRAEVSKEQRELNEVRKAQMEKEQLRQFKEENRRTFQR